MAQTQNKSEVPLRLFVCLGYNHDDTWITAIFDTREAAETHLEAWKHKHVEVRPTGIEEYTLNVVTA